FVVVPRYGNRRHRTAVIVAYFDEQVVRHNHADRAGFAGTGHAEGMTHGAGNLPRVLHMEDLLGHAAEDIHLRQRMDLEGMRVIAVGDIADDAHHRHTIEQRLADAGERVGQAWPRYDADHAGLAGASRVTVRHAGGGEFVRHEQVRQMFAFERV